MSDRLKGIELKLKRAKHHVLDIDARIRSSRSASPYGIVPEEDPQAGEIAFKLACPVIELDEIGLIAGESVHQLRSSLDHLAWQLVLAKGGTPDESTQFPIYKSPPKKKSKFSGMVKGIDPKAINLINALQPYQSGNDDLWRLQALDNFSKHRLLFVLLYAATNANIVFGSGSPQAASISLGVASQPGRRVIAQDGAVIGRVSTGVAKQMENKFNVTFDVAFSEPQVVQGETVIPLVNHLVNVVEGIVAQFVSAGCL